MQESTSWVTAAVGSLRDYGVLPPLVQLLLATLFAFVFAERWQRWRQRRDFQYRTLVKFSELSFEMMDRLSELLVKRDRMPPELYAEKHRDMIARWTVFASMRPEVMAAYGRCFILKSDYQGLFNALNTLLKYVRAPEPVLKDRFEPVQEKFIAHREAVVARMVRMMGLLSKREWAAETGSAEARVRAANRVVAEQEDSGVASPPPDATPPGTEGGRAVSTERGIFRDRGFWHGVLATILGFACAVGWDMWKDGQAEVAQRERALRLMHHEVATSLVALEEIRGRLIEDSQLAKQKRQSFGLLPSLPVEAWHTTRLQGSIAAKLPELQRALGFTYYRVDLLNQLLQARQQFSMVNQSLTNFHEVRREINDRTVSLIDDILGRMKQHQQALKRWEP